MALYFLDEQNLHLLEERVRSIAADERGRWGSLTVGGMFRHLWHTLDVSMGEVSTEDRSNFFTRHVVPFLVFHLVTTWPRGKIKSPDDYTPPSENDMETEREILLEKMRVFVQASHEEPEKKTVHPLLGPQPLRYWRRIHGVHFDHHLRQFGV